MLEIQSGCFSAAKHSDSISVRLSCFRHWRQRRWFGGSTVALEEPSQWVGANLKYNEKNESRYLTLQIGDPQTINRSITFLTLH